MKFPRVLFDNFHYSIFLTSRSRRSDTNPSIGYLWVFTLDALFNFGLFGETVKILDFQRVCEFQVINQRFLFKYLLNHFQASTFACCLRTKFDESSLSFISEWKTLPLHCLQSWSYCGSCWGLRKGLALRRFNKSWRFGPLSFLYFFLGRYRWLKADGFLTAPRVCLLYFFAFFFEALEAT